MVADGRAHRARLLRRAMLQPDRYLAAALAEIPDEDLAAELGADRRQVWRLRFASYPRADRWDLGLEAFAALLDTDVERLAALLQRVGVRP